MISRSLLVVAVLLAGCGGTTPPPDSPKADMPGDAKAGDAKPDAAGKTAAGGSTPDGAKADDKKADDKPKADAPAPPKDERLEDKKMTTAKGNTGSYSTNVLSAAGLEPAEIGKALSAASGKLDTCYSAFMSKKPPPGQKTSFDLVVDPKGKLTSAKLRADETKNPELVKCIEGALKTVAWPKPTEKIGKTSVEWALGGLFKSPASVCVAGSRGLPR